MSRPRTTALALLALLTFALLGLVACSQAPEQALLTKYFNAARMRDNTTLQNIATVQFSPVEDGSFSNVKVVSETPEQSRPLKLKELAQAERDALAADEEFNKKKKEYQDANLEAIDRVLKAERTNTKLKGADLAVQEAWAKWRDDTKHYAEKATEARRALSSERNVVEVSAFDARTPVNVVEYDGDLITKDLVLSGKLKKGDAPAVDTQLHVTLTRAELRNGPEGRPTVSGRWVVTHISPADDGKTPTVQ